MAIKNSSELYYPLTKMNFLVKVDDIGGNAAFTEITGVEASVDVIEFRQGNSNSLAPVKIPGLVKHGNITLKMGYTQTQAFKDWIIACVSEHRKELMRHNVSIELLNINPGALEDNQEELDDSKGVIWVLTNAWVCKYTAPDLNSTASEVAIESVEIAYEEIQTIPN